MKRAFIAAALLWIIAPRVAVACDLDDCAISNAFHLESGKFLSIPEDDWAWMNHDLALARAWLADGETEKAREILSTLYTAVKAQHGALVAARGPGRVEALVRTLQSLEREAGGQAFDDLPVGRGTFRMPTPDHSLFSGLSLSQQAEEGDEGTQADRDDDEGDRAMREAERRGREAPEPRRERPEPAPSGGRDAPF